MDRLNVRLAPRVKRLAWANFAAQSAEQIAVAVAPMVTVLSLGGGVGEAGLIQTAQTLPLLLFAIPIGLLADRMSRQRVMVCAEALRVTSFLAIFALAQLHLLTWPILACLILLGGCGTAAYSVVAPSLVPALVPHNSLAAANSRIELARTCAFALGPTLGGVLVGYTEHACVFGLAALLSAGALLLLSRVHEPARPIRAHRHPIEEIREGARFVFKHPLLRPIFVTQVVFNASFFMLLAVFVPYAISWLGLDASTVGVILGIYGVGMIFGALLASRVVWLLPFGRAVAVGPFSGLIAALVMTATIVMPSPYFAGLSFFLFGAGPIIWVVTTATLRQTVTPKDMLGRVSAMNILAQGARPIGAALGAFTGAFYGMHVCLVLATVGFAIQAGLIVVSPVVHLVHQPEMT